MKRDQLHTKIRWYIVFTACLFVIALPSKAQIFVEAENYANMSGIQTETTADAGGGVNVGWIDDNDWMDYTVNIPLSGTYFVSLRAASVLGGGIINIVLNGSSVANVNIAATGGWQVWATVASTGFQLNKGTYTFRIKATKGGFNLNWLEIKLSQNDSISPTKPNILQYSSDEHNIYLGWTSSKDNESAVAGYKIYLNGNMYTFTTDTILNVIKLIPNKEYSFQIFACDLVGNVSVATDIKVSTLNPAWTLKWSDEFNGINVDKTIWNYQTGGSGWGNNEAQYYTDGLNVSVSSGFLSIEARKETIGLNKFTSARMNTSGKKDFLYGRLEVKAKLPSTGGTWPAIWMLPTDWAYGGWPNSGEIDIMEHVGNNLGIIMGTVHTESYNSSKGTQKGSSTRLQDVSDAFHNYIVEWYPDHIDWYVDDIFYYTFKNEYNTSAEWPFNKPFHILLNLAVGGNLGGTIDTISSKWPQRMMVDYVRVYDFNFAINDFVAPTNPTDFIAVPETTVVNLSWKPSADNKYVKYYYIFKEDQLVDSVTMPSYLVKNLNALTDYTFSVQAIDFAGNKSDKISLSTTTKGIVSKIVPGKLQAEDFAFMYGIQTQSCTDIGSGLNVAYINTNDWLEFSIDVQYPGTYYLVSRVASATTKGSLQLLNEDESILTKINTPITGGWQKWVNVVSAGFYLEYGKQLIRFKFTANDFNVNWFEITTDSSGFVTEIQNTTDENNYLYPNPLKAHQKLSISGLNASPSEIIIYNINGTEVYKKTTIESLQIGNLNLNPGVYFVNIKSGSANQTRRLIIE